MHPVEVALTRRFVATALKLPTANSLRAKETGLMPADPAADKLGDAAVEIAREVLGADDGAA